MKRGAEVESRKIREPGYGRKEGDMKAAVRRHLGRGKEEEAPVKKKRLEAKKKQERKI